MGLASGGARPRPRHPCQVRLLAALGCCCTLGCCGMLGVHGVRLCLCGTGTQPLVWCPHQPVCAPPPTSPPAPSRSLASPTPLIVGCAPSTRGASTPSSLCSSSLTAFGSSSRWVRAHAGSAGPASFRRRHRLAFCSCAHARTHTLPTAPLPHADRRTPTAKAWAWWETCPSTWAASPRTCGRTATCLSCSQMARLPWSGAADAAGCRRAEEVAAGCCRLL